MPRSTRALAPRQGERLDMISYDEAMELATSTQTSLEAGRLYLAVAREIREAGKQGDPFSACQRPHFAVQDVEGTLCWHDLIAVRLPGATEQWWHVEPAGWCTQAPQRDRPTPLVSQAAQTAVLTLDDTRPCYSCGLPVRPVKEGWVHVDDGRAMCATMIGDRQTYAWPAAQE